MNELALFAGAGGGILGGKLLGWKTVCAVEINDYARRVLLSRQDDGCLDPFPIWDDVTTFDGRLWRGLVDVVSGGFPCQDISAAGKGAGLDGARSGLWSEFARIIREVEPRFVLVENSPMLTSRGLGRVLGDLAAMGYDASWGVLGAVDAGAPHKRERIWIVADSARVQPGRENEWTIGQRAGACGEPIAMAHTQGVGEREPSDIAHAVATGGNARPESVCGGEYACDVANGALVGRGTRWEGRSDPSSTGEPELSLHALANAGGGRCDRSESRQDQQPGRTEAQRPSENLADADGAGLEEQRRSVADGAEHETAERGSWWLTEPDVGRVAHGVASRVDRLRALGNGQVPAVVRLAWETLINMNQPTRSAEESNTQGVPHRG
jgi:DNA (cytosine-5)-methyltransferase 1